MQSNYYIIVITFKEHSNLTTISNNYNAFIVENLLHILWSESILAKHLGTNPTNTFKINSCFELASSHSYNSLL